MRPFGLHLFYNTMDASYPTTENGADWPLRRVRMERILARIPPLRIAFFLGESVVCGAPK